MNNENQNPALEKSELEEYEISLNNWDGVDILNEETYDYEERTVYTTATSLEEASDKFSAFFQSIIDNHGYNGMKPMTLWLFQRIQDGTRL